MFGKTVEVCGRVIAQVVSAGRIIAQAVSAGRVIALAGILFTLL